MLLNLSNHPSNMWGEKQLQIASKDYGIVLDIVFPAIDPESNTEIVQQTALLYAKKALEIFNNNDIESNERFVHIMGELTFCYKFVQLMQANNIQCIASTTHRMSEVENGVKHSQFNFVKFRNY